LLHIYPTFIIRHAAGAWVFQNFLGMIMAINGLNEMRFPSMQTITWALALLFLYDVFFVFVTPYLTSDGVSVMEKVAASSSTPVTDGIDGPRRAPTWPNVLVVPGYYNPMEVCNVQSFVLLGVGDIFWPGLVISIHVFSSIFHPQNLSLKDQIIPSSLTLICNPKFS
jgi:signal peptide peptidase-like protein 2B